MNSLLLTQNLVAISSPFDCGLANNPPLEQPREVKAYGRIRVVSVPLDMDHIGGLRDIAEERQVENYWGPCLVAFERHKWLFGEKIREGIERARVLEDSLRRSGTA